MNAETNVVPMLPEPVARRNISEAQWRTLVNNLYPGAASESVLMVVDYCRARKLDPLKKPCHIVPMKVKDQRSGDWVWRDVVMPGIYEYRTTATRTGLYLGHSKPEYGPAIDFLGVQVPEYCDLTVYRWSKEAQQRIEYPVHTRFAEVAATTKEKPSGRIILNDRWTKAPVQMLTKCAEAAALREAFPDELGGEPTYEEMAGQQPRETPLTVNPRDGLELVDDAKLDALVSRVVDILAADVEEEACADMVFALHQEICSDADTYSALQDALKSRQIIKPAGWRSLVTLGSKRYQERNVRP